MSGFPHGGGGTGAVSSVFTRVGNVVAASGDYTAAQVTNAADVSSASTQTFTGEISAPSVAASGITGTTSGRFVGVCGGTTGPASGTFLAGDCVVDGNGILWICTTPGTVGGACVFTDRVISAIPAPATTVTGPDAYGAAAAVGTGTTYARADHNHGLPAAPAVPTPATTVTGPDAYGASAVVGTATTYARADHDHGLPAAPADLPLATYDPATIAQQVVGTTAAQTVTSKRITKRVLPLSAGSATPAINADNYDVVHITAQGSTAITSFTSGLSGTPVDGDTLRISVIGSGAVGLTFGTSFEASGNVALPTTTVAGVRLDMGFFWNTETTKWRI